MNPGPPALEASTIPLGYQGGRFCRDKKGMKGKQSEKRKTTFEEEFKLIGRLMRQKTTTFTKTYKQTCVA